MMLTPDDERDWIFTFGYGHDQAGHFVRIRGTWQTARLEMIRRYGRRWGFQYESEAAAGVERFGLVELIGAPR